MVSVAFYYQIRGFAVAPEDVQVSDGDQIEVSLSRSGSITKVPITRKTATITIRGLTKEQSKGFIREANNNRKALLNGSVNSETLDLGAEEIEVAVLIKATASPPIQVGSSFLVEATQLEFQSQKFT